MAVRTLFLFLFFFIKTAETTMGYFLMAETWIGYFKSPIFYNSIYCLRTSQFLLFLNFVKNVFT